MAQAASRSQSEVADKFGEFSCWTLQEHHRNRSAGPQAYSSISQFGHFIGREAFSEVNISGTTCYRRATVVTLRLWTLRVHPFNDEGCAPSIRRSPIRPFVSLPSASANCARLGTGRRSAWLRKQICTEPTSAGSSADCGMCRCTTSPSWRTRSAFPSRSYFPKAANLASSSQKSSFPARAYGHGLCLCFRVRAAGAFRRTISVHLAGLSAIQGDRYTRNHS